MIKQYTEILGAKILDFQRGDLIAFVNDIIINPSNGKIEALWVKTAVNGLGNAVLLMQDIIEWKKNIYVKSESVFSDPSDIIKITEILSKEILFINNRAIGENNKFIGKIYNLDFDTNKLYLRYIYTSKSILGLITYNQKAFSYDQIIEAEKDFILVSEKSLESKVVEVTDGTKNTEPVI